MAITSSPPALELDETNVAAYLTGRRLAAAGDTVVVRRLSGGYVNNVFRAEVGGRLTGDGERPDRGTAPTVLILKQSLEAAQRSPVTKHAPENDLDCDIAIEEQIH